MLAMWPSSRACSRAMTRLLAESRGLKVSMLLLWCMLASDALFVSHNSPSGPVDAPQALSHPPPLSRSVQGRPAFQLVILLLQSGPPSTALYPSGPRARLHSVATEYPAPLVQAYPHHRAIIQRPPGLTTPDITGFPAQRPRCIIYSRLLESLPRRVTRKADTFARLPSYRRKPVSREVNSTMAATDSMLPRLSRPSPLRREA